MGIRYLKNNTSKIKGKTVFLRLDVNEPISDKGKLLDDFRIRSVLPTVEFLLSLGCRIIIGAHLGRPKGGFVEGLSLRPIALRLAELLKMKFSHTKDKIPDYPIPHLVFFEGDVLKDSTRVRISAEISKNIIFLENLRFYDGEESNSPKLSRALADLADFYVNEAFGCSHRKSASIYGMTKYLESYAGLELQKEIRSLNFIKDRPVSPYVVMMAGIKISEKAKAIEVLAKKADKILLGGGLANLFLLARGHEIGLSVAEAEAVALAKQLDKNFKEKIILPVDLVVTNSKKEVSSAKVIDAYKVLKRQVIVDLGPKTILKYAGELKKAKTIVWNGPMGYFEKKPFDTSTLALAKIVGAVSNGKCFGVVGGGETVDALKLAGQESYVDLVSTGGGAMLEFISGATLPGLSALEN